MKTLTEQIESVEREIKMRRRVYGRRVDEGRMTQLAADHEIECMDSVLETLRAVKGILPACMNFTEIGEPGGEIWQRVITACGNEQGDLGF